MAFALPGAGDRIYLQTYYDDIKGQRGKTKVEIPFDTDIATTLANALAHAALQALASGCEVSEASVTIPIVDSAPTAAEAGSSVSEDGQLSVTLDTTGTSKNPTGTIHVPFPVAASRVAASGKQFYLVDTTYGAIANLYASFETGGNATLSDGQLATALDAAKVFVVRKRVKTV